MKKILLTTLAILVLCAPGFSHAEPRTFNILLAGGGEANAINIWLTPDGRSYVIDSSVPLEVGATICANPEGNPNQLLCEAASVASFEVSSDGGDDRITVAGNVTIPVGIRTGPGNDFLRGGAGPDKLSGGPGEDRVVGGSGDDFLAGGPDDDVMLGCAGDDILIRGPGSDVLRGGPGNDVIRPYPGKPTGPL
jgi:Ca2+-binding RTX toxin-like protein